MADNSRRMLDFHIERATESMEAAGAYKVEVDRLMRYSGWHLLGTARMGDDPTTSVLDRWNRRTTSRTCTSSTARASSPRPA